MKKNKSYLFFLLIFLICSIYKSSAQHPDLAKKIDSVLSLLAKEKNDSIKMGYSMWIAQRKMGGAQNTGNWDEAIEWWNKALKLAIKTKNNFCIGRCNMFLGITWANKGNYTESLKCYYDALNTSFKSDNKRLRTAAYGWIAGCYMNLGNNNEALKNYILAFENQKPLNDGVPLDIRQIAITITGIYTKMQNWEQARKWYEKTLPYDSVIFYEGQHELQMASIQMGMGNYDGALKSYRAAVQAIPRRFNRKEEMSYKGIVGLWYQDLGETYFKISTFTKDNERNTSLNEAVNYLSKSLPLLKEGAGGIEALMKSYDLLRQACEATNDYQNALLYSNLYTQKKDSLYNKETYAKLTELEVKYKTEKAAAVFEIEQEKEKLKNDAILAAQKMEQEQIRANERIANDKMIAEQKLEQDKAIAIAGEKANYEKSIAVEKIRNEKQQANNLLLMGLILVVMASVFLFFYIRQRHEKKRAVDKAESIHKMAELEMQSLRSQLNPHFMFNSLNSIQTLILKEDSDKSHSYLSRFARLLRMLLENAEKPFVSLQKEIDFIQLYLGLENLRVPDLQYSVFIDPSLNTEQTLIPNMILQPYVENAIWHGLSYKEADKQLQIRINRDNGTIKYEIEDNGVGRKKAEELKSLFRKQHQSKGMELLSKRFKLLNGEYNSSIETMIADVIKDNEVSGTLVTIKVPAQLSLPSQN